MDSPFLGMVQYFAFDFAPKGYALANGALLSIQQNAALFSLFGTFYGGNGTTTFGIPDLRGRAIIGQSTSYTMGERIGTATTSLLTSNMPVHTHTATATIAASNNKTTDNVNSPGGNYPAGVFEQRGTGLMYTATLGANPGTLGAPTVTVNPAGGSVPFNTQNPYLAVTACVATVGLFPSRN